ncbi:MAG TPA: R3H domain-containing nucleic acid-binding protein, partial [Candidatus Saccharibacteria bacterium]|nr:R3H domain-containing nucleic acid-binding protein [Candidatus Saccharibacteria bacterium]
SEFVALDVAGYKKERIQKVQRIAEEAAAEVLHNGHEKTLPPMNSYERRQVHMVMADIPELVTRSVGDDPNRSIVISKRD